MTYTAALQQDQERIEAQYAVIEEIYREGISDAADGRLPAMPDVIYLQEFCEGMRQLRMQVRLAPLPVTTEIKEYPLLCGQCTYLNNGKCEIKSIPRNSTNYACDRVVIDSPF